MKLIIRRISFFRCFHYRTIFRSILRYRSVLTFKGIKHDKKQNHTYYMYDQSQNDSLFELIKGK